MVNYVLENRVVWIGSPHSLCSLQYNIRVRPHDACFEEVLETE